MFFFNALKIQSKVIHALILRETRTRFDRNKLGYLWALFEPIAYIGVLIAIFSTINRESPIGDSASLPLFFISGLVPWLLFSHTVNKITEGIVSNKNLLTYPQVTPFDVLVSRALLELITTIVVFVLLLFIIEYFGYYQPIESFNDMFFGLVVLWFFAIGVGFVNSSIKLYIPSYSQTYQAIQRPFFFISGVFFTSESLPLSLRELALYNPILHGIEWFRNAMFMTYESNNVDKMYLLSCAVIILAVGLSAERVSRKYARQA